jgi:hypothetical protein
LADDKRMGKTKILTGDNSSSIKTERVTLSEPSIELASPDFIERRIFLIREQKVMLDRHLAEMYQVSTKRLNEAIKRNGRRFPEDFMFQLTDEEVYSILGEYPAPLGRG